MELTGKRMEQIKVVVNGAGASGIACAEHYMHLGVKRENITMVDTKGVVYKGRKEGMNPYKERFAKETPMRTLADAAKGADVLLGLSVKGAFTPEMIASLAPRPVVFAMANPDPEITYDEARAVREDIIMATGRSDYPNQVNNVLGFPFIFRGALDVHATTINEEMKLAATQALAASGERRRPGLGMPRLRGRDLKFGVDYIIPKPFDPRVLVWEAAAVAKAAMDSGVAQKPVDLAEYREELEKRLGKAHELMRLMIHKAQANPKPLAVKPAKRAAALPSPPAAARRFEDERAGRFPRGVCCGRGGRNTRRNRDRGNSSKFATVPDCQPMHYLIFFFYFLSLPSSRFLPLSSFDLIPSWLYPLWSQRLLSGMSPSASPEKTQSISGNWRSSSGPMRSFPLPLRQRQW